MTHVGKTRRGGSVCACARTTDCAREKRSTPFPEFTFSRPFPCLLFHLPHHVTGTSDAAPRGPLRPVGVGAAAGGRRNGVRGGVRGEGSRGWSLNKTPRRSQERTCASPGLRFPVRGALSTEEGASPPLPAAASQHGEAAGVAHRLIAGDGRTSGRTSS